MPKGARSEKMAATKMTPRRPIQSLRGSEIQPALASVSFVSDSRKKSLQETDGDVGHGIDKADDPAIFCTFSLVCNRSTGGASRVGDAECFVKGQIRTIRTSLYLSVGKAQAERERFT